jgi:hypothetical protein
MLASTNRFVTHRTEFTAEDAMAPKKSKTARRKLTLKKTTVGDLKVADSRASRLKGGGLTTSAKANQSQSVSPNCAKTVR